MSELSLRTILSRATYRLDDDAVEIDRRTLFSRNRVSVPLDSLRFRSHLNSVSSKWLFWATVVSFVLTMAMVADWVFGSDPEPAAAYLYGSFALVFGAFYLGSRKSYEVYPGYHNGLYFP